MSPFRPLSGPTSHWRVPTRRVGHFVPFLAQNIVRLPYGRDSEPGSGGFRTYLCFPRSQMGNGRPQIARPILPCTSRRTRARPCGPPARRRPGRASPPVLTFDVARAGPERRAGDSDAPDRCARKDAVSDADSLHVYRNLTVVYKLMQTTGCLRAHLPSVHVHLSSSLSQVPQRRSSGSDSSTEEDRPPKSSARPSSLRSWLPCTDARAAS